MISFRHNVRICLELHISLRYFTIGCNNLWQRAFIPDSLLTIYFSSLPTNVIDQRPWQSVDPINQGQQIHQSFSFFKEARPPRCREPIRPNQNQDNRHIIKNQKKHLHSHKSILELVFAPQARISSFPNFFNMFPYQAKTSQHGRNYQNKHNRIEY